MKINNKVKKKVKNKYVQKTVKIIEQYLNILSTNACDFNNKAEDLKDKTRYFDSAVFAVQETHYRKKGKFIMKDYHIFESIRKNKEKEAHY